MIALDGIHCDVCAIECLLNRYCDVVCSISNLCIVISPNIVRGVVACPDEEVGLDGIADIGKHALETFLWDVAVVSSPWACLTAWISWEAV